MRFLDYFQSGSLVLPAALLFHYHELFTNSDDFLVWQFIYLQNTTAIDDMPPSQIASAIGKSVAEVNQSITNLTNQGLLDMRTIELTDEIEVFFDASPVLSRLDELVTPKAEPQSSNALKGLVADFERELGRLISPFELEEIEKSLSDDHLDPDFIREALKEAVLNGKPNWKYIQAILRNWRQEGITTLRQIDERRLEREQTTSRVPSVSDDFKQAMDLWIDK